MSRARKESTVLLVEDDELLLSNLAFFFRDAGFSVSVARSGREGLDALHQSVPDLVVTDISMPKMNGLAFIQHARFFAPSVPIIISSAFSDREKYRAALQLGVQDFFAKPWDVDQLVARAVELVEAAPGQSLDRPRSIRDVLEECTQIEGCAESLDALIRVTIPEAFSSTEGFMEWAHARLGDCVVEGSPVRRGDERELVTLLKIDPTESGEMSVAHRVERVVNELRAAIAEFVGQPIGMLRYLAIDGHALRAHAHAHGKERVFAFVELLNQRDQSLIASDSKVYMDLAKAELEFSLPAKIGEAVESAPEQLSIYWQPKIRLIDGVMVGAEALARWEVSPGEFVRPDLFVKAAKDWGILRGLSVILWKRAAESARSILELLPEDGRLSLNVEPSQILEGSALVDLLEAVQGVGLSPSSFILEVTEMESVPAEFRGAFAQELAKMKAAGFGVSIDDFSQGASAIQQVIDWPIDELKIDRAMTSRLESSEVQVAFLASTGLANALGVPVVAEGVEEEGQVAQLRDLGVQVGQGYFWSRPLPAEEICAWHAERSQ
ncbi:MAG: EAL domain-containing protein [Planctomycetota bacterium]|jgi:EAL domain-containing protein (putative c-di-GMP-specific phosphodiesterase class I)/response regulator RpfG family c-di-GMP phosphodiesterase